MIPDYALRLSENQTVSGGSAASQHVIDLLQARNIALGEPLYAVITITTTFDASGADDPLIQWTFYASDSSSGTDSSVSHQLGASSLYSCNVADLLPRNLQKGQKITVPLVPITNYAIDTGALGDPITSKGRRYIYGGFVVTGGSFTAGAFNIDICTQAMLGGTASTSDVSVYPTGITIA